MSDTIQAHLYGGHADGETLALVKLPKFYDVPTKSGDRHPSKGPFTRYLPSPAWSARFERETMVPMGFPGLPPKQAQAA